MPLNTTLPRQNSHALLELVHTLFDEFRSVGQAHAVLLTDLKRASEVFNLKGDVIYDMKDFWTKVQEVVSVLFDLRLAF